MKIQIIPTNNEPWKHAIAQEWGSPLTVSFTDARIDAMNGVKSIYSRQFLNCYSKNHYNNTVRLLVQAKESLL